MTRILVILLSLTHGLWFGGLVTLFLLTTAIRKHDIELTRRVATPIFTAFETYHLVLGGVALLLLVALWPIARRSAWKPVTAALFGIGLAAAITSASLITPRLEQLRRDGQSGSDAFRRVHTGSRVCFGTETVALLAAGLTLGIWNPRRRDAIAATTNVEPVREPDLASTGA